MYDHDGTYLHSDCDPQTMPRKTKRGRKAVCNCDKRECRDCRRKASHRRWYAANAQGQKERHKKYRKRKTPEELDGVPDSDLDQKATQWLEQRGLR